jgi:DNA mismatch repair protein MutL
VHLRRARERIWYERLLAQSQGGDVPVQRLLFPQSLELSPADGALLAEVLPDLRRSGFEISPFGAGTFVIQGVPPGMAEGQERGIVEEVLDKLKHAAPSSALSRGEQVLLTVAKKLAYADPPATQDAMRALIDELFACAQPEFSATGKKVFSIVPMESLMSFVG